MDISENFLPPNELGPLQIITSRDFPWFSRGSSGFTHGIYNGPLALNEQSFRLMEPLIKKLNVNVPVKCNVELKIKSSSEENVGLWQTSFSHDVENQPSDLENIESLKTAIYFLSDTNNGYIEFRNGDKAHHIQNSVAVFPANVEHRFISHTSGNLNSIIINLNYLQLKKNQPKEKSWQTF